ncbi:hypothetical protein FNF27_05272 [Cafeteria roenbergensis]|uniref:Thioesterase domain-containing protein n=3 Tax=Cafeteria roenbergensis TaxID=33653 RepID=A0A5A8E7R4_CAFRO|nr:hypothetical protein FNF27_05272 [Cafeteria roenbergensis]
MLSRLRNKSARLPVASLGACRGLAAPARLNADFDAATESVPMAGDAARRAWTCHGGFSVAGVPNGGYIMATIAKAAVAAAEASGAAGADPVALSAFFLRPAEAGAEYELNVETLKAAKRMSTHSVRATRAAPVEGALPAAPTVQATVTLGTAASPPTPGLSSPTAGAMPVLPPPEQCESIFGVYGGLSSPSAFPIALRNDARFDPAFVSRVARAVEARKEAGAIPGQGSGFASDLPLSYDCWLRFPPLLVGAEAAGAGAIDGSADARSVPGAARAPYRGLDALSLLFFSDSLPPPALLGVLPGITWVPTIEMSVQVRGEPTPGGWLVLRHSTRFVTDGWLEADTELWDAETGRLVGLGRQMAMLMGLPGQAA